MPVIRLIVFKYYALLISSITLNSEIMSPCSYYVKKGLVCIIITEPFGRQPSSYSECTKLNTCVSCDVRLVPFNKYTFFTCFNSL